MPPASLTSKWKVKREQCGLIAFHQGKLLPQQRPSHRLPTSNAHHTCYRTATPSTQVIDQQRPSCRLPQQHPSHIMDQQCPSCRLLSNNTFPIMQVTNQQLPSHRSPNTASSLYNFRKWQNVYIQKRTKRTAIWLRLAFHICYKKDLKNSN